MNTFYFFILFCFILTTSIETRPWWQQARICRTCHGANKSICSCLFLLLLLSVTKMHKSKEKKKENYTNKCFHWILQSINNVNILQVEVTLSHRSSWGLVLLLKGPFSPHKGLRNMGTISLYDPFESAWTSLPLNRLLKTLWVNFSIKCFLHPSLI